MTSQQCDQCQNQAQFMCSACGNANYCSAECQRAHWSVHSTQCNQSEQVETETIAYYIEQLYNIMQPVMLCIILSVVWVKLANPPSLFFATGIAYLYLIRPPVIRSVANTFGSVGGGSDSEALMIAGIIMGQIVVVTIVFALLMKYGKIKVIYGILLFVVVFLLGWVGYQLVFMLLQVANAALDWPTLVFGLWNFIAVGIAVIFWKGPDLVKKGYLVMISSMMAYSLSQLPELVTWILLGFLAIWVLCPYGPLRIMIESAQRNNVEIPEALIYTAMVWMMASPGNPGNPGNEPLFRLNVDLPSPLVLPSANQSPVMVAIDSSKSSSNAPIQIDRIERRGSHSVHESTSELIRGDAQQSPIEMQNLEQVAEEEEEEEEPSGLKLGLGDFVFYSVLVGRASLYDWITTIGCILAVITGLVLTIMLLVAKRKPLPALPISIFLGILIFVVSTQTLSPMLESLVGDVISSPLLRAGSPGVGFLYL